MADDTNTIPPVQHPMGRYWEQPDRRAIALDGTHALMELATFEALADYSGSIPSGVYPGKMWKCEGPGCWYLRWFGIVPGRPEVCSNNQREIILC